MNACRPAPLLCIAVAIGHSAHADTVDARCDVYPAGEDRAVASLPCTFSQRQGYVVIQRDDGVTHDLSPVGDRPGNFVDQQGRAVYRNSGLGESGLIFRTPTESVYVYWDTSSLAPRDPANNPTAPYDTFDYDATTLLSCGLGEAEPTMSCPAGIKRGLPGAAEIRTLGPAGVERTLYFEGDTVGAPDDAEVRAERAGDEWRIEIDGRERYVVPDAAITGG